MTKVIVFGSFDPLHKGHLDLFSQAKALGDCLVVVVASDEKILANKHRKSRLSEADRLTAINNVSEVDEVLLSDKNDAYTILDSVEPDIIALGYDQKIPELVRYRVGSFKNVILEPYRPDIYKSTLVFKASEKVEE